MKIWADFGATSFTGLSVKKIIEAVRLLRSPDDISIYVDNTQLSDLAKQVSNDYPAKWHKGRVSYFMDIPVIRGIMPKDGLFRTCFVFGERGERVEIDCIEEPF